MKKDTTAVLFLLLSLLLLILPWSQAHARDTHDHKPADSALVRSNIVGKVVDAQGNPLEKVKVTVLDPDTREVVARGVTNEQGEYVIECLDPRQYHLILSALPERFVGQTVVVNLGKDGQIVQWAANAEVPAVATMRVGGGACGCGTGWLSKKGEDERRTVSRSNLIGKVVDAQGTPIKKVAVTVFDADNQEIIARRMTDDNGNYAIECLDQRKYNLVLGALPEQFLARSTSVDLGKDGLDVHWAANTKTPEIDTAKMNGGVCSCAVGWLGDGSQAGVSLAASPFGTTPVMLGTVGVVVGGGVTLGILLSGGDSGGSHDSPPPPPASPSR